MARINNAATNVRVLSSRGLSRSDKLMILLIAVQIANLLVVSYPYMYTLLGK